MQTIKSTLITNAIFSDNGLKRYLLTKTWDSSKANLAIIMLAPSEAAGVTLDSTSRFIVTTIPNKSKGYPSHTSWEPSGRSFRQMPRYPACLRAD